MPAGTVRVLRLNPESNPVPASEVPSRIARGGIDGGGVCPWIRLGREAQTTVADDSVRIVLEENAAFAAVVPLQFKSPAARLPLSAEFVRNRFHDQ